jgi:hypothetical protein
MRRLIGIWLPGLVSGVAGLLVLGGYFLPSVRFLAEARSTVLEWAIIIGAFGLLLGLLNIVKVHGRRIANLEAGWPYSLILLLAALAAWIPGILPLDYVKDATFEYILGPLGAGLAALMVFALVLAAVRMLRVRQSPEVPVFLVVVGVVLLGSTPLAGSGLLAGFRDWLIRVPGMAGARGLLLGVALGTVITGLRVILATERPQAEPGATDRRDRGEPGVTGLRDERNE